MRFVIALCAIITISYAVCLFLPWYSIAVVAAVIMFCIPIKNAKAFLCGFFAIFLLWTFQTFAINANNNNILSIKLASLILKTPSPNLLIIATGVIGGLVGGFAALTGNSLRHLLQPIINKLG